MEYIDIVFDGPPENESGRFIEIEDDQKRSISIGRWIQDGDYWRLRLSHGDVAIIKDKEIGNVND